jgi:alcohol dehydrogenase class IV
VYHDGIREFYSPTHLIFGWGAAARTGIEAKRLGAKRVFVVTDQRVHGAGLSKGPIESLREAGIGIVLFADCEVDPAIATVENALRLYLAEGWRRLADLPGTGGGSARNQSRQGFAGDGGHEPFWRSANAHRAGHHHNRIR